VGFSTGHLWEACIGRNIKLTCAKRGCCITSMRACTYPIVTVLRASCDAQAQMQAIATALQNTTDGAHHDIQVVLTDGERVVCFTLGADCSCTVNGLTACHAWHHQCCRITCQNVRRNCMHVFAPKPADANCCCAPAAARYTGGSTMLCRPSSSSIPWTEQQLKKLRGMNPEKVAADDVCGVLTWEWAATPFTTLFGPMLSGPTSPAAFYDGLQVWIRLWLLRHATGLLCIWNFSSRSRSHVRADHVGFFGCI
jgi:hypothetical protein